MSTHSAVICVDFDGTIADHVYPDIGRDVPGALRVLRELRDAGHRLVLWTMRCDGQRDGDVLSQAVAWCRKHGIEFDCVNEPPWTQRAWTTSPKVHGLLIDDNAIGCPLRENPRAGGRPYVDWDAVREILVQRGLLEAER